MPLKCFIFLILTVLAVRPVLADENTIFMKVNSPTAPQTASAQAPKDADSRSNGSNHSNDRPQAKKWGERLTAFPKATAGMVCGVTFGVPAKIAKEVSHESLRMRNQLADDLSGGDKPDLVSLTLGSSLGMPYGLVSGVIKGSIYGVQRGVECGRRKPFSRESMSLTDPH